MTSARMQDGGWSTVLQSINAARLSRLYEGRSFRFRRGHVFHQLGRHLGTNCRQRLALGICCTSASRFERREARQADPVLACSFRFRRGHVFRQLNRLQGPDYRQKLALGICCTSASHLVLILRLRPILPLLLLQSFSSVIGLECPIVRHLWLLDATPTQESLPVARSTRDCCG
jgi:hypothetical protein